MTTTFSLSTSELDEGFLNKLRAMFSDKRIEILVHEQDETEYLRSNPANREHLNKVIADIESGRNIIEVDQAAFE
jgi:hypothetical protein